MWQITAALAGLAAVATAQQRFSTAVKVKWLEGTPKSSAGTTFGLPWARGQHPANGTTFTTSSGELQSWVTAYWPDGTIKWSAHAIAASENPLDNYVITASGSDNSTSFHTKREGSNSTGLHVTTSSDDIVVNTGKISASFAKSGSILVPWIKSADGKIVGQNGRLILRSQSGLAEEGDTSKINFFRFGSKIYNTTVSEQNTVRAL